MPSLKDLRNRISSVKSTKKNNISNENAFLLQQNLKEHKTMKKTRPYATKMQEVVSSLTKKTSQIFKKKDNSKKNLIVISCSADEVLCGDSTAQ